MPRGDSNSNDASMLAGVAGMGMGERPGGLRYLLIDHGRDEGGVDGGGDQTLPTLLADWDLFVQHILHAILDHQMVGSYSAISNLSCVSQVSQFAAQIS